MQKTAYEMRISDWSSDVCSSDLRQSHHSWRDPSGDDQGRVYRPGRKSHDQGGDRRLCGTDADSAQRVRRRKVRADGWRRGDAEDHRRVRAESGGVTLRVKKPGSKLGERLRKIGDDVVGVFDPDRQARSEEHTSELQSL